MKRCLSFCAALLMVGCCSGSGDLVGSWVEPIPGQENQVQGIQLDADGTASSINMYTLVYESWSKNGESVILKGKSIGNGQTIDFVDTMSVIKLTQDSLVLGGKAMQLRYARQK